MGLCTKSVNSILHTFSNSEDFFFFVLMLMGFVADYLFTLVQACFLYSSNIGGTRCLH